MLKDKEFDAATLISLIHLEEIFATHPQNNIFHLNIDPDQITFNLLYMLNNWLNDHPQYWERLVIELTEGKREYSEEEVNGMGIFIQWMQIFHTKFAFDDVPKNVSAKLIRSFGASDGLVMVMTDLLLLNDLANSKPEGKQWIIDHIQRHMAESPEILVCIEQIENTDCLDQALGYFPKEFRNRLYLQGRYIDVETQARVPA